MRVLLTGGTGFVGSHIAKALLDAGHEITLLARTPEKVAKVFAPAIAKQFRVAKGEMTDDRAVAAAVRDQQAVIHAAAVVALERKHAARVLADNRRGVEVVLGGAVAAKIERIVYVSSVVAWPRPSGPSALQTLASENGASAYTQSKLECEMYLRSLQSTGATIHITYPAGVVGPEDPTMTDANRGLLAFFRHATVVTDSGLQMVDVRDVAKAHATLLQTSETSGHHVLGGNFLPWGRLVDLIEEVTGRKTTRWPVSGRVLRAAGVAADVVKRVWDFRLPLSGEGMRLMTQWVPLPEPEASSGLRFEFRDPRETLRDTLLWFHATDQVSRAKLGKLAL